MTMYRTPTEWPAVSPISTRAPNSPEPPVCRGMEGCAPNPPPAHASRFPQPDGYGGDDINSSVTWAAEVIRRTGLIVAGQSVLALEVREVIIPSSRVHECRQGGEAQEQRHRDGEPVEEVEEEAAVVEPHAAEGLDEHFGHLRQGQGIAGETSGDPRESSREGSGQEQNAHPAARSPQDHPQVDNERSQEGEGECEDGDPPGETGSQVGDCFLRPELSAILARMKNTGELGAGFWQWGRGVGSRSAPSDPLRHPQCSPSPPLLAAMPASPECGFRHPETLRISRSGVLLRSLIVLAALGARLLAAQPALAQSACTITQITHSTSHDTTAASLDGGSIAFASSADLTGQNPIGGREIFLFDGSKITQITHSDEYESISPSLDRGSIAFTSRANLGGGNPEGNSEVFLFDGSTFAQITDSTTGDSFRPSLDRGSVAFQSSADLTGSNPGHLEVVFLFNGSTTTQITTSAGGQFPSLDQGFIAFRSSANLTGGNSDGSFEVFLFDGFEINQITDSTSPLFSDAPSISLNGGSIAFTLAADLTGDNPDGNFEVFLFDGSEINQITDSTDGSSSSPSFDGRSIAFGSSADLTGGNPDLNGEIFLFDGSTITQVTDSADGDSSNPSLDGDSIAFDSTADLTGENPGGHQQIFLASCPALVPPPGPFLTPDEIPGFQFKVRISAGDNVISGQQEADCIRETLCVSGALPGRSELFLRMIGPRPNGFLWANLVRFTTSRVEVWAEQISTGLVNYYDLPALVREDAELTGLVDKEAFPPTGAGQAAVAAIRHRTLGAPGVTPLKPSFQTWASSLPISRPEPVTFTSNTFPGYLFTVRIFAGSEQQPVQVEEDCIPETICVSGAIPGRSELFLRIIGPRPNGFLWTNLVRFTTSRVEVEIEQLSTGETKVYVLEEVPRESDQLPGRVDKEAFLP